MAVLKVEDCYQRLHLKFNIYKDMSYLDMHLGVGQGRITICMKAYVDALMEEIKIVDGATSSAKSELLAADKYSKLVSEPNRKSYYI